MKRNAHGALNRIYKYCRRRSTTCGFYQDQLERMLLLTRKQQGQWFIEVNLSQYLQSFACRHQDLVNLCEKMSVSQITRICFRMSCSRFLLFPRSWPITEFDLSSDLTGATQRVPLAQQEPLSLLEHHMSPLVFVEFMLFYLLFCVRCFGVTRFTTHYRTLHVIFCYNVLF